MITVVGAGPAGSYFARLMRKEGHEVRLLEEHKEVGKPFQCTGIVTTRILEHVDIPQHLDLNRMERVKVFSPNGDSVVAKSTDIILDRTGFDAWMAEEAVKEGVELLTECRFLDFVDGKIKVVHKGEEKLFDTDIVIGADGPSSNVAKKAGIFGTRVLYYGMQMRVEGKFDPKCYDVHLDVPDFFGWVVPESATIARIGLAVKKGENPREHFERLMEKYGAGKDQCTECKRLDPQGGAIPLYDPALPYETKVGTLPVYLIGDAAFHVKATTGGGIIQGFDASIALREHLTTGIPYKTCLKKLRRELRLHLLIRDTLNKFSEKDTNKLVTLCNGEKLKKALASESRDRPIKLLWNCFVAEPRLALYGKFLF